MPVKQQDHLHTTKTQLNQYDYMFTTKHHGAGHQTDAQWLPTLSDDEEFTVFDLADLYILADSKGNLFGGRWVVGGKDLLPLGTHGQEIAKFWYQEPGMPWHGFPACPLNDDLSANRSGQVARPEKAVITRMFNLNLISKAIRKRLMTARQA